MDGKGVRYAPTPLYLRPKAEIVPIFQGLQIVELGIVKVDMWETNEAEGECQPKVLER